MCATCSPYCARVYYGKTCMKAHLLMSHCTQNTGWNNTELMICFGSRGLQNNEGTSRYTPYSSVNLRNNCNRICRKLVAQMGGLRKPAWPS